MQKWKVILLVAAILVQSFYCPVMAREARFLETAAPVLDLSAKSAVVMEQESKEILFAKDKDKELAPASVTKIMSLLLIFEDLKQGKIKLTDTVTVSEHAASMGGSQVFLETGEKEIYQLTKSICNIKVPRYSLKLHGKRKDYHERKRLTYQRIS